MGASNHPNHPALARRVQAYLRWRNAKPATPTAWQRNAGNVPASAANASNAGADPEPPHDQNRRTYVVTALVRRRPRRVLDEVLQTAGGIHVVAGPPQPHRLRLDGGVRRGRRLEILAQGLN